MKKAFEYCIEYNSELYMILRTRRDCQIYIFDSGANGDWPPSHQYLVRLECNSEGSLLTSQETYYPLPVRKTLRDLASEYKYDLGELFARGGPRMLDRSPDRPKPLLAETLNAIATTKCRMRSAVHIHERGCIG